MTNSNLTPTAKAAATRARLQREALRLFTERGFDDVTVEEIARAAGVSHMTFFRNFPTKESVVLDDPYDPAIGKAIASQDRNLPPIERVRRGFLEAWTTLDAPDDSDTRVRIELAAGHPTLRARVWENTRRTEEVVVDALTGTGVDPFDAHVAAGAVNGALTAALFAWATDSNEDLGTSIVRALDALASVHGTDQT